MAESIQISPGAVAKLFESMLGRKVTVKPSAASPLKKPNVHIVSEYCTAAGALDGLSLCDLPLGCNASAALSLLPPGIAAEAVKKGRIDGALAENFQELANVLASVYNRPDHLHINLRKLLYPGAELPSEVIAALPGFSLQLHLELEIANYVGGKISFYYR